MAPFYLSKKVSKSRAAVASLGLAVVAPPPPPPAKSCNGSSALACAGKGSAALLPVEIRELVVLVVTNAVPEVENMIRAAPTVVHKAVAEVNVMRRTGSTAVPGCAVGGASPEHTFTSSSRLSPPLVPIPPDALRDREDNHAQHTPTVVSMQWRADRTQRSVCMYTCVSSTTKPLFCTPGYVAGGLWAGAQLGSEHSRE